MQFYFGWLKVFFWFDSNAHDVDFLVLLVDCLVLLDLDNLLFLEEIGTAPLALKLPLTTRRLRLLRVQPSKYSSLSYYPEKWSKLWKTSFKFWLTCLDSVDQPPLFACWSFQPDLGRSWNVSSSIHSALQVVVVVEGVTFVKCSENCQNWRTDSNYCYSPLLAFRFDAQHNLLSKTRFNPARWIGKLTLLNVKSSIGWWSGIFTIAFLSCSISTEGSMIRIMSSWPFRSTVCII